MLSGKLIQLIEEHQEQIAITRIMHRHTSIRATSGNKTDGRGLLL
jgi:hypothetical protein